MSADLTVFELPAETALSVFTDVGRYSDFYKKLKAETDNLIPDISTKSGRDEIKTTAFKITKVKTSLDKTALALTEDWRTKTVAVNKARAVMVKELEGLANTVRKPLTDWEEAEENRLRNCRAAIDGFKAAALVSLDATSTSVKALRNQILVNVPTAETFLDMFEEATDAHHRAVVSLANAEVRLVKEEADRAELKRLQDADAERQRLQVEKDAAEQAERESEERARIKAEQEAAATKAEEQRIEKAKHDAAAAAELVAKEKAEAYASEVERKHQAELAAEKKRADEATAAEAKRVADAKAEADEQTKRDVDQAHRTAVKSAAKQALMTCGADEDTARKIVMAILAAEVPNVTLRF